MKTCIRGGSYRRESYPHPGPRRPSVSFRQPVDVYDDGESSFEASVGTPRRVPFLGLRLVLTEERR